MGVRALGTSDTQGPQAIKLGGGGGREVRALGTSDTQGPQAIKLGGGGGLGTRPEFSIESSAGNVCLY